MQVEMLKCVILNYVPKYKQFNIAELKKLW